MKRIFIIAGCFAFSGVTFAQLRSSENLNSPANAQPVPNSTVTEKSAPTPRPLIAPAANPIPPIYPGAEAKVYETQRELVFPAAPPSPTQPAQREPLTPIDATNVLKPTRPQREEASRPETRSIPVQRTARPSGIEQAQLSGESAVIKNPFDRKPIVSRTAIGKTSRTRGKAAQKMQAKENKIMPSERPVVKKKMNTKKYTKKKAVYKRK